MISHRIVCLFFIILLSPTANSSELYPAVSDSEGDFTIYQVKTQHPFTKYERTEAPDIEDIILARIQEGDVMKDADLYDWKHDILTESQYKTSKEDKCIDTNGNCSHSCETVGNQAICSCPRGFTLVNGTDCQVISSCDIVVSGTSGKFEVDEGKCKWIIRAPENHIIHLTISSYNGNGLPSYGRYSVYDGNSTEGTQIRPYSTTYNTFKFRSSGPYLLIGTEDDWDYSDIFGEYKTGLHYLTSNGENSFHIASDNSEETCFSITYTGDLNVYVTGEDSTFDLMDSYSFEHHDFQWKTKCFRNMSIPGDTNKLHFQLDDDPNVLAIRECLDIEYYLASFAESTEYRTSCYNSGSWSETLEHCVCLEGFSGKYCEQGSGIQCHNGGVWSGNYNSCLCPPGFVGEYCEEGCGANRYGKNCSKLCSLLSTGCEGVIFCQGKICSCGPGFHGKNCGSSCPNGMYGASCLQDCGHCKYDNTCDRYTGQCSYGCKAGYYPPFCQQTYKVLRSAPGVVEIGYTFLRFRKSLSYLSGEGHPKFFEVQYKEEREKTWSKLTPQVLSNEAEFEITGLLPGRNYLTRVILIDEDGGSYQLDDVPQTKAMTKCKEPHQGDVHLLSKEIHENQLTLEWSYVYDRSSLSCVVKQFELSLMAGERQFIFPILEEENNKTLSNLIPDTDYKFQLIGTTATGNRVLSPEIIVHTLYEDPGRVVNAQTTPLESGDKVMINWQSPWNSAGIKVKYHITYKCLGFLACSDVSCLVSNEDIIVDTNSALLEDLQPHALYEVQIAAMKDDKHLGEPYTINFTTEHAAPQIAPSAAEDPVVSLTNVSAIVTWLPPENCALLNGYFYGYLYKLIDNSTGNIINQGSVRENIHTLNFTALKPSNCYSTLIGVVSSGGIDFSNTLSIPFCTIATAPDKVQSLKVYKKSRRMVGLKWAKPLNIYGDIVSFKISYSEEGTGAKREISIEPKHCHPWPDFFCHTVSGLSPGRKYSFVVQARNNEVGTDGEPASVEAVTTEGASSAPINLTVINATEKSIKLKWCLPDNINGQLRSFIIITEQVDNKGASDECCEAIPLVDYRVTSEEPSYTYEVTGLSAASTYSVTVAAKTLTLGKEARITAHTYPPKGLLPQNAISVINTQENSDDSDTVSLRIQPASGVNLYGVKRTYFLLLMSNKSSIHDSMEDDRVMNLLQASLPQNFQLLSEYSQEELEEHQVIKFHLRDFGFHDVNIQSCKYALVLLQDYMGNQSVDISIAES